MSVHGNKVRLMPILLAASLLASCGMTKGEQRSDPEALNGKYNVSENAGGEETADVEAVGSIRPEVSEISEEIFEDLAKEAEIYTCLEEADRKVILVDLKEEREFGCLYLDWDADVCGAVTSYRVECYEGGEGEPPETEYYGGIVPLRKFVTIHSAEAAPYPTTETVTLDRRTARYLRIDVEGADTVPEVRILSEDPWEEVYDTIVPWVSEGHLVFEGLPEWLTVEQIGCNPSAVIDEEGNVQDILEDMTVQAGITLSYDGWRSVSPDYCVTVRAMQPEDDADSAGETVSEGDDPGQPQETNPRPQVLPAIQEWRGDTGSLTVEDGLRICADEELLELAGTLAEEIEGLNGWEVDVCGPGEEEDGDIILEYREESSLGEEGYRIRIDDTVTIAGYEARGIFWGTRTLLQMMVISADEAGNSENGEGRRSARIDAPGITLMRGEIRDYPAYPVRGVEVDVARNSVSMHMLREMMKNLSWYKINELTVHLNDNALLVYSDRKDDPVGIYDAYSAFRLESSVLGSYGGALTAQDLYYTKEEFSDFTKEAAACGVSIIPEIDTPAHSLAITRIFRYNGLNYSPEAADMLDLSKEGTAEIVERIWDDALPAFEGCETVHIGGDEYYGDTDDYIRFENRMIDYLNERDRSVRLWGSLTGKRGSDYVQPRDQLELLLWNADWAEPEVMYDEGYRIVNADHNTLYIIPGGGYDHPDTDKLYESFEVNRFECEQDGSIKILPTHNGQVLGAQLCIWNDLCDNLDIGIGEYDIYDRLDEGLPYFSCKCWSPLRTNVRGEQGEDTGGENARAYFEEHGTEVLEAGYGLSREGIADLRGQLGQAPLSNPYDLYAEVDDIAAEDPDALLGPKYRIGLTLTMENPYSELILCDAQRSGNSYTVYLRDRYGRFGLVREDYEYLFETQLPVGESVDIVFEGDRDEIRLYINGEHAETIGSGAPQEEHATVPFPVGDLLMMQESIQNEGVYVLQAPGGAVARITKIDISPE